MKEPIYKNKTYLYPTQKNSVFSQSEQNTVRPVFIVSYLHDRTPVRVDVEMGLLGLFDTGFPRVSHSSDTLRACLLYLILQC